MPPASKVNFFFSGSRPTLGDRLRLKKFIISIFKQEKKQLESISFIFTNDEILYKINKEYLARDYYTDIITFELSAKTHPRLSEVYISCERVKENARIHKSSFKEELHRVIFHGVLHLCGYNDKTKKQSKDMRNRENYYLDKYFK